ncbi:armadillo repeat-containing protein 8-like isoform X2 [Tigriopus californicus]|uniref:armadillo repeat-containing protein 8-like isoform X2 n=1 Tax=Tigriopus californicus TaxID=6832 RepID=UPI0027DA9F6C|nr:armadillo repeat-containing protein 8-like isoform X2 [Tigriopus californicus]
MVVTVRPQEAAGSPARESRRLETDTSSQPSQQLMDVESPSGYLTASPSPAPVSAPMSPLSPTLVEDIESPDEEVCLPAVLQLRSRLIGSNRQKHLVIEQGLVTRLLQIMIEPKFSNEFKIAVTHTLGSLAKGLDFHVKALIDHGAVPVLLNSVVDTDPKLIEASLGCLRSIFQCANARSEDTLYSDPSIIPHLIGLMPTSVNNQISVATILTSACKTREHQDILCQHGLVPSLFQLLGSPHSSVQLPGLQCLTILMFSNENATKLVSEMSLNDQTMIERIETFMDRHRKIDLQLEASKCIAYLYRCGVLDESDKRITFKALPCVVRMTKKEASLEHRIFAADTLSYLIEISAELQRIAAISNHLISSMASFLTMDLSQEDKRALRNISADSSSHQQLSMNRYHMAQIKQKVDQTTNLSRDMKRSAFKVYAALGANDEEIRKRIIDTEHLLPCLLECLEDSNLDLQTAAIGCLHSLSRSVQLLRTTFQDHPVWRPLMNILSLPTSTVGMLIVASSTLCNLLLEFSPSKEPILESGAISLLCQLTHKFEPALRLNGVWALMNLSFQADQMIKVQIIKSLESDQVFRLLADQDVNVVMKTLGLIRNILSNKNHIDNIMGMDDYGKQIMQAVVLILESDRIPEVKEQALCILGHIADGDAAKDFIMSNEDVLKKVISYMTHHSTRLRTAAVFCIQNLIWAKERGATERQQRLKQMGVDKILQQLFESDDATLAEKISGQTNLML